MCGIAGYVGSRVLEKSVIERCLKKMGRRGPDDSSYRAWTTRKGRQVYFLHTRLSIIDLNERSNQPFGHQGTHILLNGEIYNYLELRDQLIQRDRTFRTTSDTEVLIQGLSEWGTKALEKAEGMWAFATLNESTGEVMLSRDRFGEKPLYLYRDQTGLYFGSEIKFLFELLGYRLPIDFTQVYRYLVHGYKSIHKSDNSFFVGISQLPSGSLLQLDQEGKEKIVRYWNPPYEISSGMTYPEAVQGVRERLSRSMELRLRADVPLAFCMSGGVDSNALISIAKKVLKYDVHGFTIMNSDSRYEEGDMVRLAVKSLGIRHTEIPVTTTHFLDQLRTLICQHDAPVYTITYYAHWLLMKAISEGGYRIAVSGTGADELFTGYYDHHLAYLYEVRKDPSLFEESKSNWRKYIAPIVRNPFLQRADLFLNDPSFRDHVFFNSEGFANYLRAPFFETFHEEKYTEDLLRNRMLNEMFHETVPAILHEDDHNAMYYSVENRSPFLDRSLFEFAFSVPPQHFIRAGYGKVLLREAIRGIAPDEIVDNRRKVGFNAPIFSFLDHRNPEVQKKVFEDSPIFDHVKREPIQALMHREDLPNSESKFLFSFLSAKMFLEEYAA